MKLFRFILSMIDSLRQRGRQCRYCKYFIETNSPHGICGSAHSDEMGTGTHCGSATAAGRRRAGTGRTFGQPNALSINLTRLKVNCTDWCKQYKERGKDATKEAGR